MSQNHSHISLAHVQEDEEQEERHTGDDVRVQHRDVVQEGDGLLAASLHVVDSDSCDGAEYGGHNGRDECDDQGVLDCRHQRSASLHVTSEEIGVEPGRESGPVAQDLALGEREDRDEDDRSIEHDQQQPYVALSKKPFHHTIPPLTSFLLSCNKLVIPMITSITSDRAAP